MSSDEIPQNAGGVDVADVPKPPTEPAAMAALSKKRPRLNLTGALQDGNRERRRGKTMFGILVGTLNKAKIEDKERNASEAAKKRQLIEQRLQLKLRKETDSVRRAEEAKKDRTTANRKEEDLLLKDVIYKFRRKRLPLLTNFLLTSDVMPSSNDDPLSSSITHDPLAPPPRSHPPPLYFSPAILTPSQEAFLARRKEEVQEAVEKEWQSFCQDRTAGIEEITKMRQNVVEEEVRQKQDRENNKDAMDTDVVTPSITVEEIPPSISNGVAPAKAPLTRQDTEMDVDVPVPEDTKKEKEVMQTDDDDAVEY